MPTAAASETEPILGGFHVIRPREITSPGTGLRLMSDLHIGAAHVDYRLIKSELDDAEENGDRILINGDIFDFILPKDAKRYDPGTIHPRIGNRSDPITPCIQWGVELFGPVAHLIDMIGVGNHETAVQKWHGVDPTLLLLFKLQEIAAERDAKHVIHYGGYTGFVDYRMRFRPGHKAGQGTRWVLYYHHGSGGAAPVTKGLIDFNRKDVFIDADMIWMGHKHNRLVVTVEKLRCPVSGDEPDVREVHHCMTGAYFQTYRGQSQASIKRHGRRTNYAADMGLAPGGKGGLRVVFELSSGGTGARPKVRVIQ